MLWSREARRLARRVDKLEAEVQVLLQLSAIQLTDPGMYDRVIQLASNGWEVPEAARAAERPDEEKEQPEGPSAWEQLGNLMRYTGREQPQDAGRGE